MDRRTFVVSGAVGGLGWALAPSLHFTGAALAGDSVFAEPLYIADMHFHLFFFGKNSASKRPLRETMADGNATLVSWSLVGDVPWIRPTPQGLKQKGSPKSGEATTWFREELARAKRHLTDQNIKIAATADDIALAAKGEPRVVLSVEGASFLDDDIGELQYVYEQGVRHLQLVHFVRNKIGDFQTERPQHNGLTAFGRDVIRECNRLGILIDLAHCTPAVVSAALDISIAPMVWSHSSVTHSTAPKWSTGGWQARQLSLDLARAIAAKRGVVGLWALRSDVGATPDSYAERILKMADWLGEDHVAFGTDMNAISNPAIARYADLQRVVRTLHERQMSEALIRKIAFGNYARVLQDAFIARRA